MIHPTQRHEGRRSAAGEERRGAIVPPRTPGPPPALGGGPARAPPPIATKDKDKDRTANTELTMSSGWTTMKFTAVTGGRAQTRAMDGTDSFMDPFEVLGDGDY